MQEELGQDREDIPEDPAQQIPMGHVLRCGFRVLIDNDKKILK